MTFFELSENYNLYDNRIFSKQESFPHNWSLVKNLFLLFLVQKSIGQSNKPKTNHSSLHKCTTKNATYED